MAIGPALPPGFKLSANGAELSTDDGGTSSSSLGAIATSSNEESRDLYGPSLPPGFAEPAKQEIIGPVLPPGFAASTASSQTPARRKSIIGPTVPPDFLKIAQAEEQSFGGDDDSSSDSFIGPKPSEAVGEDYAGNQAALDFDRRATKMKRHLEGKDIDTEPQREAWMTELPDNLGLRIGLGARTFRKNMEDPTADRSMWTDSPADKERKAEKKRSKKDEEEPARLRRQNKKEEELTEQLAHYNKEKRSESLLDMHRKKRKVEVSHLTSCLCHFHISASFILVPGPKEDNSIEYKHTVMNM